MGMRVVIFTGGPQDLDRSRARVDLRSRVTSALDGTGLDEAEPDETGLDHPGPDRPDLVIAADSGLGIALEAGFDVDGVVGDMDSVDEDQLRLVRQRGAEVLQFPVGKDETDLELAIDVALESEPDELVVVGSPSGRLDHLIGWTRLVSSPRLRGIAVTAWLGSTVVLPVFDSRVFRGTPGATVSLFAEHGDARGVTTRGLRWDLNHQTLRSASSLGVSNEFETGTASVEVGSGVVAVVIPPEHQHDSEHQHDWPEKT